MTNKIAFPVSYTYKPKLKNNSNGIWIISIILVEIEQNFPTSESVKFIISPTPYSWSRRTPFLVALLKIRAFKIHLNLAPIKLSLSNQILLFNKSLKNLLTAINKIQKATLYTLKNATPCSSLSLVD